MAGIERGRARADDSEASAPSAYCGSSSPERNSIRHRQGIDEAGDQRPQRRTFRQRRVASASATLLPVCGDPTEVTEATRSGRTEAT
jgi:hypothetical protein